MLGAMAAVVLAACTRIETSERAPSMKPTLIGFSSYTPTSKTKVNDTFIDGTALVTGKQFAVYAWQTPYEEFLVADPGVPDFMTPAVVTWNNDLTSGSGNGYEPKRYWPSGDTPANLSFTAYYPYGGAGITPPTFGSGSGTDIDPFVPSGVGTYAFDAPATSAAMVDFCVADVVNDQTYGNTNKSAANYKGTVNFSFHHMLTKVQFRFKTNNTDENTTVKLVEAKLYNIKTTGTLTASFTRHKEDTDSNPDTPPVEVTGVNKPGTTTTSWSGQGFAETPITYQVTLNKLDPTPTSEEIPLTNSLYPIDNEDIFLMVPQTMVPSDGTNPQYLEVTWKVITDGVTTTNTKKLYFDDCTLYSTPDVGDPVAMSNNDWAKNSSITYTITIGPNPIYITGTATNWAAEQNGYFNP